MTERGRLIIAAACAVLPVVWSCAPVVLPQSAPRQPVTVTASLERTRDAVLAIFAERNITVTQDSTGTIVFTGSLQLPEGDSGGEDCPNMTATQILRPQFVTYRVGFKGDGTTSNVTAFAYYSRMPGAGTECASRGTWETQFESEVKRRAEQQ